MNASKFAKMAAAAEDMTKPVSGGSKRTPPAKGPTGLRYVGYFEGGDKRRTFKGEVKIVSSVRHVFELVGKKHPPVTTESGIIPVRMTVEVTRSQDPRSANFALFQRMNYKGEHKHFVQMLGQAFRGTVVHREGASVTFADLDVKSIGSPTVEVVGDDGEVTLKQLAVGPALTDPKAFLWNHSDLEDWDALYIPGEYPERKKDDGTVLPARSKNVLQEWIMGAANFDGSPIDVQLKARATTAVHAEGASGADGFDDDEMDDIPY